MPIIRKVVAKVTKTELKYLRDAEDMEKGIDELLRRLAFIVNKSRKDRAEWWNQIIRKYNLQKYKDSEEGLTVNVITGEVFYETHEESDGEKELKYNMLSIKYEDETNAEEKEE